MSKGIQTVSACLKNLGIQFELEKTFEGLKFKRALRIDIYFHHKGRYYAIEYDGKDHFSPRRKSTRCRKECRIQCDRDRVKDTYCFENGINLLRIAYTKDRMIDEVVKAFINNNYSQVFAWYVDKTIYQKRNVTFSSEINIGKATIGVISKERPSRLWSVVKGVGSVVGTIVGATASFTWIKILRRG